MRELSLPPGPILGQILQHLLDLVTHEPALNHAPALLALARAFVAEKRDARGGAPSRG
jgi:hypothetical protein